MKERQTQDLRVRLRHANDTFISLCCWGYEFLGEILTTMQDLPDLRLEGILFMDRGVAGEKNGNILTKIRIAISC